MMPRIFSFDGVAPILFNLSSGSDGHCKSGRDIQICDVQMYQRCVRERRNRNGRRVEGCLVVTVASMETNVDRQARF